MAELPFEVKSAIDEARQRYQRMQQLKETMKFWTLFFALGGLLFSAGYNWSRIEALLEWQKSAEQEYVKKDVLVEQFKVFNQQMADLQRQILSLEHTIERSQEVKK